MSFLLKPTRMSVTDLRPSLSYRVGVPARSRATQHWVELALATDAALFATAGTDQRTPANFAALSQRFEIFGDSAIIHVPPAVLLTLSGGERLYASAALFDGEKASTPISIITADADAVYVAINGFSGAGIQQRFGFAGRPGLTGAGQTGINQNLTWAGDQAVPSMAEEAPGAAVSAPPAPPPHPTKPGSRAPARELPIKGTHSMNSHSFMHQNLHHPQAQQPAQRQMHPTGQLDYDDGFGEMAAPAITHAHHDHGGQSGSLPYGGAGGAASQPLDYVLPVFDSYKPSDVWSKLKEMWERYESYSTGVNDTSSFPFSAICLLRPKFYNAAGTLVATATGTGFYIGPNLILTCGHNFAASQDDENTWLQAHTCDIFIGHNSTRGDTVHKDDAIQAFSVSPSDWSGHPNYDLDDISKQDRRYDLAVIRTSVSAPNGHYFNIANFSPAADTSIAVCGYGASSAQQGSRKPPNWRKLLPTASFDGKQHMDTDIIRGIIDGGERITYNLQTLSGNSGSPVFIAPQMSMPAADAMEEMAIVAVHTSGHDDYVNAGVWLTPDKRDWALGRGLAKSKGYQAMPIGTPQGQPVYAQEQALPLWVAGITAAEWIGIGIGTAGLGLSVYQNSSNTNDIKWQVAKMDSWLEVGATGPKELKDANIKNTDTYIVTMKGPRWDPMAPQGMLYADFQLRFEADENGGVGKIWMSESPLPEKDTTTGSLTIVAKINPKGGNTYKSMKDPSKAVARVDVYMDYVAAWTIEDSERITVLYSLYGDGTVESRVVTGSEHIDNDYISYGNVKRHGPK